MPGPDWGGFYYIFQGKHGWSIGTAPEMTTGMSARVPCGRQSGAQSPLGFVGKSPRRGWLLAACRETRPGAPYFRRKQSNFTCMVTVGGSASNWNSMPPDFSNAAEGVLLELVGPPMASLMTGRWLR